MTSYSVTNRYSLRLIAAMFILTAGLMPSCAATRPADFSDPTRQGVRRVVVLPFENMTGRFGENAGVTNPLTGKVFVTGPVAENAAMVLTEQLHRLLLRGEKYTVIPPVPAKEARADISATAGHDATERQLLMETGRHFAADAVLTGRLYRYVQRVGGGYGIESPASVAFDLVMIHVETGRVLWRDHLDETQTSLTENLFSLGSFLKRKGRWVTAEEMAEMALSEMIGTLQN